MSCLKVDFYMKIVDFLKSYVLPRREHHFWRSGCDLDGLWNHQNCSKVISERVKREQYKTSWKFNKINEVCKIRTLTKCRIYHTDLMFWVFVASLFLRKNEAQKWCKLSSRADFWSRKNMSEWWQFGRVRIRVSYRKHNGLRDFWRSRSRRKWIEKHIICYIWFFEENHCGNKFRFWMKFETKS